MRERGKKESNLLPPLQDVAKDTAEEALEHGEVEGTQHHLRGELAWKESVNRFVQALLRDLPDWILETAPVTKVSRLAAGASIE